MPEELLRMLILIHGTNSHSYRGILQQPSHCEIRLYSVLFVPWIRNQHSVQLP